MPPLGNKTYNAVDLRDEGTESIKSLDGQWGTVKWDHD